MTITVTNEDGTPATLPVTPPTIVCVNLSADCRPGRVDLRASDPFFDPSFLDFAAGDDKPQCFKVHANITGLVAANAGSDDVTIV